MLWCDRKHDYDRAIAAFKQAVRIQPRYAFSHFCLGNAFHGKGRTDDAIAAYREALRLHPGFVPAHTNLALCLQARGRLDEALREWREAASLKPDDAHVCNTLAWLLATIPEAKLRDPAEAVRQARRAVALQQKNGGFWHTLGVAHYRAGDWQSALEALAKSMALRQGGDSVDWLFLAMSHAKLGHKPEARDWYDRATRSMDKNPAPNEELRRFRAEAAELLGVAKTK
jgi:Flp pilus assembly protein TadD